MHDKILLIKQRRHIIRQIRNLKKIDPKHVYLKPLQRELNRLNRLIAEIGTEHLDRVSNLTNYIRR